MILEKSSLLLHQLSASLLTQWGCQNTAEHIFFLPSLVCLNLDTNQMIFRPMLGRICLPSDAGNPSRTTARSPNNYSSKNSSSLSCHFNYFTATDGVGASLISYYKYHTCLIFLILRQPLTQVLQQPMRKKQTGKMLCAFTATKKVTRLYRQDFSHILFPISLFSVQNTT